MFTEREVKFGDMDPPTQREINVGKYTKKPFFLFGNFPKGKLSICFLGSFQCSISDVQCNREVVSLRSW